MGICSLERKNKKENQDKDKDEIPKENPELNQNAKTSEIDMPRNNNKINTSNIQRKNDKKINNISNEESSKNEGLENNDEIKINISIQENKESQINEDKKIESDNDRKFLTNEPDSQVINIEQIGNTNINQSNDGLNSKNEKGKEGIKFTNDSVNNKNKPDIDFDKNKNKDINNSNINTIDYNYDNNTKTPTKVIKNNSVHKSINTNDKKLNNYEKFHLNKNYFLICPDCNKNILKLESSSYDSKEEDFLVIYKCVCNKNNKKYFYQIISEKQNLCEKHKTKLNIFCEICNILFCEECKNEHNEHKIKYLTYKEIFSEEIKFKFNEKKEEFQGIDIIQNIFEFYKKYYNDNTILDGDKNNGENITKKEVKEEEKKEEKDNEEEKEEREEEKEKENKEINQKQIKTELEKINEEKNNVNNFIYKNTKTLKEHKNRVTALIKLSNDLIASGSYDNTVKIWDINKKENDALIMNKYSLGNVICLLEFEPGMLLGGIDDKDCKEILLWDLNNFRKEDYIHNFNGHESQITSLVKCDESYFASSSLDAKIIIWDYKNKKLKNILERHESGINAMIMLKNGNLCSADLDNYIMLWDWKHNKCLNYFQPHGMCVKCLLELDNGMLIMGSEDETISIWDKEFENQEYLKGHKHSVRTLCQIDDNYFASGSFDNTIKIWNLKEKKCVQTLEGHKSNVICVIKYDDKKLISCSLDNTIKIWEKD